MSVPYESFLPEVMAHIRDCPQEFAVNAIRNACIQFCDETHWLTYQPDPMTVLADVTNYDLDFDSGVEPVRLVWLKLEGQDTRGYMTSDYQIVLANAPAQRIFGALTLELAIRPARTSTTVDDSVYNRWADGIAAGARARLQDTPGQPYTDDGRAKWNWALFRDAVALAKADSQRKLTVGPLRVQMRRF